jgi:small subunit ribosomal protein S16
MKRMGKKKKPFYRLVAADSRMARDGRFIEMLGHFDPMTDPEDVKLDYDKIFKWLDRGAELSDNVSSLFRRVGLLERWRLLKEGVKITELDAVIELRREKQPARKSKEEKLKKVEEETKEDKPEKEKETKEPAKSEEVEKAGAEEKKAKKIEEEKVETKEIDDQKPETTEDSEKLSEDKDEKKES